MENTFLETPLMALSYKTRYLLSTMLNTEKCVPATTGFMRDWRGIADVCSVDKNAYQNLHLNVDHIGLIFEIIHKDNTDFTVKDFVNALVQIQRFDVIDDCKLMFEQDCKQYLDRVEKATKSKPIKADESTKGKKILTYDDQVQIQLGKDEKQYDAFILYADEDAQFAKELMDNLEGHYNLQICDRERDLVPGTTFEHDAILTLISERCRKLLTIFSPAFFESEVNKFFLNFGAAQGISVGSGMIIPLVYKQCTLPPNVMYYTKVYYQNNDRELFYSRLVRSIKPPTLTSKERQNRGVIKNSENLEKYKKPINGKKDERMQAGATKKPIQPSLESNKTKSEKSKMSWNMSGWKKKVEQESHEDVKLPSLDDLDSLNNVELNENKKSQSREQNPQQSEQEEKQNQKGLNNGKHEANDGLASQEQNPQQSEQEEKQNQNGLNNGKHEANDGLASPCKNKPPVSPNRVSSSENNEAGAIPKNTPTSSEKKNTPTSSEKRKTPTSLEKKKSITPRDLTSLFSKKFGSWKKRKETKQVPVEDMEFPTLEGLDSLNDLDLSKNTQGQAEQQNSEPLQLEEQNVEMRENEPIIVGAIRKSTSSSEQKVPECPQEMVEPVSPEPNEASSSRKKEKKQKRTKRDSSPSNLEEKSKGTKVQRYLRRVMQKDKTSE
ncbi:hypothetical protein TKK_0016457 [Trichogramma kaykai]